MDNENYSREELISKSYLRDEYERPTGYYDRNNDSAYENQTRYYNDESDDEYEQPSRSYNRSNEKTVRDRKSDKNKNQKDYLTRLILIQSIVCVVLFLFLVSVSKISSNSYGILKNKFNNIMANDMTVSEVVNAFKSVAGYLIEPASQWKNNDESVNATTKKSETTTNSTTTTSPTTTTTMNEMSTTGGAGGEDIELDNLQSRPQNTTFAPYMTTTKITLPVEGSKISSYFGFRINPVTGKYSFHTGLDLAVDSGTKIAAAYSGTVEKTGENSTSGKFILLKHANGLETYYCHCSEITANEGANVKAGETIALVGSTGSSTGPHLHFEIRINGIRYNPLWLLKGMVDEA